MKRLTRWELLIYRIPYYICSAVNDFERLVADLSELYTFVTETLLRIVEYSW